MPIAAKASGKVLPRQADWDAMNWKGWGFQTRTHSIIAPCTTTSDTHQQQAQPLAYSARRHAGLQFRGRGLLVGRRP